MKITTDAMIAFMVGVTPSECLAQDIIRGAMAHFGAPERAVNAAYKRATLSGQIRQRCDVARAPAYQGSSYGYLSVPTGRWSWERVEHV